MEAEKKMSGVFSSLGKLGSTFKKNPVLLAVGGGVVIAGIYAMIKSDNVPTTQAVEDVNASSDSINDNSSSVSQEDFSSLLTYVNDAIATQTDYINESVADLTETQTDYMTANTTAVTTAINTLNTSVDNIHNVVNTTNELVTHLNDENVTDSLVGTSKVVTPSIGAGAVAGAKVATATKVGTSTAKVVTPVVAKPVNSSKVVTPTVSTKTATVNKTPVISSYSGVSIVDGLKSAGVDSSFSNRAKLAVANGIVKSTNEYKGTASQNTSLLNALKK